MEAALAQITQYAATSSDTIRRQLINTLQTLAYSLEDEHDTINRVGYLHLQTAAVKIGFDLGLFKFIASAEGQVTLDEIVKKTGADPIFLSK